MRKRTIFLVFMLLLTSMYTTAQETIDTTGGEATGSGGTSSYSVGQIIYSTNTGTSGSEAQGVQQPFEISTVLGTNEIAINLALRVYPNPTANFLTLKVAETEGLTIILYDIQGKLIARKTINDTTTIINLENQSTATYFLNVIKNNKIFKIFKIIKN